MKNKTKLHRTPRRTRRFPTAATAEFKPATNRRHDLLVLCAYPGMTEREQRRPDQPNAA